MTWIPSFQIKMIWILKACGMDLQGKLHCLLHVDACTQIGAFKQVHIVFFEDVKLFNVCMFFSMNSKVKFWQNTS